MITIVNVRSAFVLLAWFIVTEPFAGTKYIEVMSAAACAVGGDISIADCMLIRASVTVETVADGVSVTVRVALIRPCITP